MKMIFVICTLYLIHQSNSAE